MVRGVDPWKVLFRQTAEPGRTSLDPGLVTKLGGSCTIRAPLLSLLPTEFVARQVKFPASFMSTLLISKEAVPSTNAIWYLSDAEISLPSLNQDTLMGREPAILQSNLQVPLTTLSTLRKGLVKNGGMSRSNTVNVVSQELLPTSLEISNVYWPLSCSSAE